MTKVILPLSSSRLLLNLFAKNLNFLFLFLSVTAHEDTGHFVDCLPEYCVGFCIQHVSYLLFYMSDFIKIYMLIRIYAQDTYLVICCVFKITLCSLSLQNSEL